MANETCPHCGAAMQMFSSDEDWCPKCKHYRPGSNGDNLTVLRNQLATVTAERDELRRELEELRDRMLDAGMEAREEPCST